MAMSSSPTCLSTPRRLISPVHLALLHGLQPVWCRALGSVSVETQTAASKPSSQDLCSLQRPQQCSAARAVTARISARPAPKPRRRAQMLSVATALVLLALVLAESLPALALASDAAHLDPAGQILSLRTAQPSPSAPSLLSSLWSSLSTHLLPSALTATLSSTAAGAFPNISADYEPCPGAYCGRLVAFDAPSSAFVLSRPECGACPSGYRSNGYICLPCSEPLPAYSWMFLVFMLGLSVYSQLMSFDLESPRFWVFSASLALETVLSFVFALLSTEPFGTLRLTGCHVSSIDDWYSMLHNPTVQYAVTLQCGQEAVYPLYTLVFKIFAFQLLLLVSVRLPLACYLKEYSGSHFIYAGLSWLPLWSLVHAVLAGVLYYAFPYICIAYAFLASTFAMADAFQRPYGYRKGPVTEVIQTQVLSLAILIRMVPHALMCGFGVASLLLFYGGFATGSERGGNSAGDAFAVILCPLVAPLLFLATERFTRPLSRYRF